MNRSKRVIQKFTGVLQAAATQDGNGQKHNFTVNENSWFISTKRNMLLYSMLVFCCTIYNQYITGQISHMARCQRDTISYNRIT